MKNIKTRVPGALEGIIVIHKDFNQLPPEMMDVFGMTGEPEPSCTSVIRKRGGVVL